MATLTEQAKEAVRNSKTTSQAPAAVQSTRKIKGLVSIKPYVSEKPNMGHEKYDEVLFPGTAQMDSVMCLTRDNIKTYITGLNEYSADIQSIRNDDEKLAKIRAIRETVAYMENAANANFKVSPKDCMNNYGKISERGESLDTFWDNVTMFQSVCVDKFDARGNRIESYWDKLHVDLNNDGRALNLDDVHDLAIYHVISAGGFGLIAPSYLFLPYQKDKYQDLHKTEDVATIKTEFPILKNKAAGILENMRVSGDNKLFYMAIMCAPQGAAQYKMGSFAATPQLQLYADLDTYLSGKAGIGIKEAVNTFLKYNEMKIDEIENRCYVKVATELRLIDLKHNGQLCYLKKDANLGKNLEDIVSYLGNPLNQEILDHLRDSIVYEWTK